MTNRELGKSGIKVAPIAFGGNVFGWTADEAMSFRLLDAMVDTGFNLLDTADVYSRWVPGHVGGESETIIGKWLKSSGKRGKIVLATKVGKPMADDKKGLSRGYIRQAVEASLQRLQTDYIDLYQSHEDDAGTPLEETLAAFAELIKQGKVRAIGASNYGAARLAEALRVSEQNGLPRYESLQPQYNLYERAGYEAELEPLCRQKNVGVIGYFSLASGFLTGKYRTKEDFAGKARAQFAAKYLNERGLRILAAIDQVARRHNSTPARVSLAWLIARPGVTAPIASATNLEQWADLTRAVELKLDPASIELLNQASA